MKMADSKYEVPMQCSNCNHTWQGVFHKGMKVSDKEKCPNCGTGSGHKDRSAMMTQADARAGEYPE